MGAMKGSRIARELIVLSLTAWILVHAANQTPNFRYKLFYLGMAAVATVVIAGSLYYQIRIQPRMTRR